MTTREQIILKRLLTFLKTLDGNTASQSQVIEGVAHDFKPAISRAEVESAIRFADGNNWITGVFSQAFGVKWAISDDGVAQLNQF